MNAAVTLIIVAYQIHGVVASRCKQDRRDLEQLRNAEAVSQHTTAIAISIRLSTYFTHYR